MPIICKICQREFKSQITNSHLIKHGLTVQQYKEQYGDIVSQEYITSIKARKPRTGWKHSEESKQKISHLNQGKTAHNKGKKLSDEQLVRHMEMVSQREQHYRETKHPKKGTIVETEIKQKISTSIKKYARDNHHELLQRAQKIIETKKQPGGYFERLRHETMQQHIVQLSEWGFTLVSHDDKIHHIKCLCCGAEFKRVSWYEMHIGMCPNCNPVKSISREEQELSIWLADILGNDNILRNDRTILEGFELDIVLPKHNIAIEYNGLYWHSELAGKQKYYHRTKYLKCKERNIQLIQIFEDEWLHQKEKVKKRLISKLGQQKPIFARKTKIVELSADIARSFLNKHHIQNAGQGGLYIGLTLNNDIVAVMSFTRLSRAKGYKTNIQDVWELNRYASNGNIIGGGSKIFKYFVNRYDPIEIISYADLRWNTGVFYEKIGMTYIGDTQPNYWYINGTKRIHRYQLRKQTNEPTNITEWELRKEQGYNRIWDCGHSKWVWKRG